jgi:nucleoside-diphosphate-sugar epimerase
MNPDAEIARRLEPRVAALGGDLRVLVTGGSGFIGTNLVEALRQRCTVANFDLCAPRREAHMPLWRALDLRDRRALHAAVRNFRPDLVLHAAARTDLAGQRARDYDSNTQGTDALLEALDRAAFAGRAIFFSSMLTNRPGATSSVLGDGDPDTTYGESKLAMEQLLHAARPGYRHCVVRPSSIWGPWFAEPYRAFFRLVARGRYIHPGPRSATKTFGFVANTVHQILALAAAPPPPSMPIYLGDAPPTRIAEWADEIADAAGVARPRRMPAAAARIAARIGDVGARLGLRAPLTSRRLQNLWHDHVIDLAPILALAPTTPFTRAEGNRLTLAWLRAMAAL